MSKFKVGDKVRILATCGATVKVGELAKITDILASQFLVQSLEPQEGYKDVLWHFCEHDLELAEDNSQVEDTIVLSPASPEEAIVYSKENKREGLKFDNGKAPVSLIPVEAILEEAEVFGFGAKKYGRHNFRLGMDYSRVVDALLRHTLAIVNGEDIDQESGLPHRAHARCCLSMLTYMQRNNVGTDDRYKQEKK